MFRVYQVVYKRTWMNICTWKSFSKTLSNSVDYDSDLENNPFFQKYVKKISALQKSSPEEFLSRIEKSKEEKAFKGTSDQLSKDLPGSSKISPKKIQERPTYTATKTLDKILKLDLLKESTPEEIKLIWQQHHEQKKCVWAVIPGETYDKIYSKSMEYPTFLFPLPRNNGYEYVVSQFLGHSCYFTLLINFQAYKENAPVCLTVSHYPDLKEEKGIVLMNGDFDEERLVAEEAQCLINQFQLYYCSNEARKEKLLWCFNKDPQSFKHMDLISEFQSSLSVK